MKLIIIVAVSENGCIGDAGKIPWHFSEDLKHFKRVTMGNTIVMGRKTFESIGNKVLPGRKNVVLSSTILENSKNNVTIIKKFEDVFKLDGDIYVCGGFRLYKEAFPVANEMIVTHVPGNYEGDTFFPVWPINLPWKESSSRSEENGLVYKSYEKQDM